MGATDHRQLRPDSKRRGGRNIITSKYMLRPGTRLQEWVCENNQDPVRFEELDKKGLVTR